jgi:hypothetical protein
MSSSVTVLTNYDDDPLVQIFHMSVDRESGGLCVLLNQKTHV